ncbi:MAG TPA: hypothetical protein VFH66_01940 [Mycobacteriales bacterium]|nr:hypothetical protein [Mycobacteriales bacterium]
MSGDPRLTRRAVLLGALAFPLAACRPHRSVSGTTPAPHASADADALQQAVADEEQLLLMLGRLADLGDVREQERGVHAAHLAALQKALGDAGATATPSAPIDDYSSAHKNGLQRRFDRQRRVSARRLRGSALAAADGSHAALLASIAACHNTFEASDGGQFFGSPQ